MAATKRKAEGEALPKQSNNREEFSIPRLLDPTIIARNGTIACNELLRVTIAKPARRKKKNV